MTIKAVLKATAAVMLLSICTQAKADSDLPSWIRFGPDVGVYIPTDSKTRDRFGDSWVAIGFGMNAVQKATTRGRITADFDIIYKSKDGNRVLMIPIGLAYRQALPHEGPLVPYWTVSANALAHDLKSVPDNVDTGVRITPSLSAGLGVAFTDRAFAEARYLLVDDIKGIDLSGFSLRAGYRF